MSLDPSVVSEEMLMMHAATVLPTALMGGTTAMRAAGQTFLPKEEAEGQKDYDSRLARSFLFNGYGRTIEILAGEAFDKPASMTEEVPGEFVELAANIDNKGNDLTSFGREFIAQSISDGIGFIHVDAPQLPTDEEGEPIRTTLAEDQKLGRRPYWVQIKLLNVLGGKYKVDSGALVLTQFRFVEYIEEEKDQFTTEEVRQIRVLEIGQWQTWREVITEGGKKEWILYGFGPTGLNYIPIVPYFTGRKNGFLAASPPLRGLAELNQAHWISSSDQNNILHFARVPILFGKGLKTDDNGSIIIAPRNLFSTDNPDGDLKYVEHTGAAIGDGWSDLERLEQQMALWGLNLISQNRSGDITATEVAITGAKVGSFLNATVIGLEKAFNVAKAYTCDLLGISDAGGIKFNTDFSLALSNFDNATVIEGYKTGIIDRATAIEELKRRGVLSPEADPVEIAAALLEEQRTGNGTII